MDRRRTDCGRDQMESQVFPGCAGDGRLSIPADSRLSSRRSCLDDLTSLSPLPKAAVISIWRFTRLKYRNDIMANGYAHTMNHSLRATSLTSATDGAFWSASSSSSSSLPYHGSLVQRATTRRTSHDSLCPALHSTAIRKMKA